MDRLWEDSRLVFETELLALMTLTGHSDSGGEESNTTH